MMDAGRVQVDTIVHSQCFIYIYIYIYIYMARNEKHKTRQFDSSYPLALVEATPMEYKPTPKLMDVFIYLYT